jgi:hypothetical protein
MGYHSGCTTVLAEGNLNRHGGFREVWSPPSPWIGDQDRWGWSACHRCGFSGRSAHAHLVGGSANIVICSQAIASQTQNRPLMHLSRREP